MATKMTSKRKIHCSFCDTYYLEADQYAMHLESEHADLIPQNMSGWQFYYYQKTGKMSGKCVICKKETTWNDKTHKYNRFCNNPKCKDKYREMFKKRMIGKYGKIHLLNDPDMQRKMLANRSIAGEYTWSKNPNIKIGYVSGFEKKFLEFLDLDLDFDPNDIMSPSPHTYYYTYEGKEHFYIPDFFIPSLDLEVEIKDGGNNPNTIQKIVEVDKEKERLKDAVMKSNKNTFNYVKIVNNEFTKFFMLLNILKEKFQNGDSSKIFMP